MRKVLIGLLVLLAVAGAGLAGYVWLQPSGWKVEKSQKTSAPPAKVYGVVSDLRGWADWWKSAGIGGSLSKFAVSPKEGIGANLTIEIPGAPVRVELIELKAPDAAIFEVDPSPSDGQHRFRLKLAVRPDGDGSVVTATMDRQLSFTEKLLDTTTGAISKTANSRLPKLLEDLKTAAEK